MIIFIFIAFIVLIFVGLRWTGTSSSSKQTYNSKKNTVYDLSGKNYLL